MRVKVFDCMPIYPTAHISFAVTAAISNSWPLPCGLGLGITSQQLVPESLGAPGLPSALEPEEANAEPRISKKIDRRARSAKNAIGIGRSLRDLTVSIVLLRYAVEQAPETLPPRALMQAEGDSQVILRWYIITRLLEVIELQKTYSRCIKCVISAVSDNLNGTPGRQS
jgi:hypothetical protein